MEETAIKVENLSKVYKLYDKPIDRLKESVDPFRKKYHRDFFALNDISFEVKKGETIGIIGKNGSGKSTLLKIITGVLTQSTGAVTVNGKIAALLELGAGFNPEYTGMENIYLNGALMGYSRAELEGKVSDILEFADIGEFINQPVKMYSSGMFVRLAFAVAISVDPDILIVDEALAVGDVSFQQKCYAKFREFEKRNKTIIFVSHALETIKMFCSRTILLNDGHCVNFGKTKAVCDEYLRIMRNADALHEKSSSRKTEKSQVTSENESNRLEKIETLSFYNKYEKRYGSGDAKIVRAGLRNEQNELCNSIEVGEIMQLILEMESSKDVNGLFFGYGLRNLKGQDLYVFNGTPEYDNFVIENFKEGQTIQLIIKQKMILVPGDYMITLSLVSEEQSETIPVDIRYDVLHFNVSGIGGRYYAGCYSQDIDISINI